MKRASNGDYGWHLGSAIRHLGPVVMVAGGSVAGYGSDDGSE